jgi:hypothetical protein
MLPLVVVLACVVLGRPSPNHRTHSDQFEQHALISIGLHENSTLMDLIDVMEAVRLVKPQPMDLEAEFTNYELAIYDTLFESVGFAQSSIQNLDEMANRMGNTTDINEKAMTQDKLLAHDFTCLPPVRVVSVCDCPLLYFYFPMLIYAIMNQFGEALQVFNMYAQGKRYVTPMDLQRAYQESFRMKISPQQAAALISALQYNPRPIEAPETVMKCEFVKGYMEQRGFIKSDMVRNN